MLQKVYLTMLQALSQGFYQSKHNQLLIRIKYNELYCACLPSSLRNIGTINLESYKLEIRTKKV